MDGSEPIAYLLPPLRLPSLSTVAALNWNNQQVQNIPSERSGTKQNQPKTILDFPKICRKLTKTLSNFPEIVKI